MARKKKSRRRSRKSFSLLNALESLTYAEIISRGTTGGGVWSFITGAGDLKLGSGETVQDAWLDYDQIIAGKWEGTEEISLNDMMMSPAAAVSHMAHNFQKNLIPMAASAFGVSVGFKIGKRLLRNPINNINRNLVKPALGSGIRL